MDNNTAYFDAAGLTGSPLGDLRLLARMLPIVQGLVAHFKVTHIATDSNWVLGCGSYVLCNFPSVVSAVGPDAATQLRDLFTHYFQCQPTGSFRPSVRFSASAHMSFVVGVIAGVPLVGCVNGGPDEVICLSSAGQLAAWPWLRYAYARGNAEFSLVRPKLMTYKNRHYQFATRSVPWGTQKAMRTWAKGTGGMASQFFPGVLPDDATSQSYIRALLEEAIMQKRISYSRQNGCSKDFVQMLGASKGKLTSKVMLKVNNQDEFHIHPV